MQKAKTWFIGLLALAILGGVCYGLYAAVTKTIASIGALDEETATAIIAACATVIVSVATLVYNQRRTKAREIANSHRPQKIDIYKYFMEKAVVGLLRASKEDRTETEQFQTDLQDLFFNFTGDVIVWGSPGVIKAYSDFRACGEGDQGILLKLDGMLREIRKDLGNSNWGLNQGDLIALFLTDPESLQKLIAEHKAT